MSSSPRFSWAQILGLAVFAIFAFAWGTDWSEIHAQDAKTIKNAAKNAAKKSLTIEVRKKNVDAKAIAAQRPTPGAGQKLDQAALTKLIDSEIAKRLKEEGYTASGKADDTEFFRRIHLDLVGVIPTAEKVQAFLDSKEADKRAKVIDALLADERFGKFLGEIWSGSMLPRESNNRRLDHKPMVTWLAGEFNKNTPINQLVYNLLTATGNQGENGAVTYYVANPTVDKMTDNVTKMFLGVQLQCAQCHNHPFTDWKQKEYWGMAQFFVKVRLSVNPQQAAKKGIAPGIFEANSAPKKGNQLPESAMKVAAKYLGGAEPKLADSEPYRPVLAKWICSPDNAYFARAMVNRFWHHLFGRGIVNPVDDMHDDNLPSHPELLSALTEQFKASGFNLKFLMKAICNSETYQRTSRPNADNKDERTLYSHRSVRAMLPEQLYESLVAVVGKDDARRADRAAQAKKGEPNGPRDQFLRFFRVVDEPDVLEYQSGIPQALRLMNSGQTNNLTSTVARATKAAGGTEPGKVLEQIYLIGLSRRPSAAETERLTAFVRQHPSGAPGAYGDILWAILNSSEFVLNH